MSMVDLFKKHFMAFYRRYLRQIKPLRAVALFVVNVLWLQLLSNLWSDYRQRFKVVTLADFLQKRKHFHIDRISAAIRIPIPISYCHGVAVNFDLQDSYISPSLYQATVFHAKVIGRTSFFLMGKALVCHDLFDASQDFASEEWTRKIYLDHQHKTSRLLFNRASRMHLKEAVSLTDVFASNYAHWLTEVLPKAAVFAAHSKNLKIPILINQSLHINILHSLRVVLGDAATLVEVPDFQTVEVDRLQVLSVCGYVPHLSPITKPARRPRQGVFSSYALGLVRSRVLPLADGVEIECPKKIYIRRNSSTRVPFEQQAIEDKLVSELGFTVVEPEKLNFLQQVKVFSSAEEIVGPTGAAFANLIFCKPSAKIVIFMSDHPEMVFWYWQTMAAAVNCRVTYVVGRCEDFDNAIGLHVNYHIAWKDVRFSLEKETIKPYVRGKQIYLREITSNDAAFVLALRTNPEKGKYLSPTSSALSDQLAFIERYKQSQTDFYFVICNWRHQSVGTIRIYDIQGDVFCWGSWILSNDAPRKAAIESVILLHDFSFFSLHYKATHFDVRKDNERVIAFYLRYGARIVREDEFNYYFEFTREEYIAMRPKYEAFLP